MALLGKAAVAMWWTVPDEHLGEFNEWHSKEHLPERLGIPGFNRGSRWQRENSGAFFVIYELVAYDTLVSPDYLERLNHPTPWSTAMMPFHHNMVRSQCRVLASQGRGVSTYMCTIKLSPKRGYHDGLEAYLRSVLADLPERVGVTGAHLLRTETPEAAPTREQKIRGADAVADWVVIVAGHNQSALNAVCSDVLGESELVRSGAEAVQYDGLFRLIHAVVPQDVKAA